MKLIKFITVFAITISATIIGTSSVQAEGWVREVELGYDKSSGNTDKSQLSVAGAIKKISEVYEFHSKFDIYYSESDGVMDSQEWSSETRYAFDFGDSKRWFNAYKLTVDHDRFADIDYRILPSVGIGYWILRDEDMKWNVEGSLGYEITNFRSDEPEEESAAFVGSSYFETKIFEKAKISENFSVIPSLDGGGNRIKSETALTNPLNDNLDLSIKYIVDYDSEPSSGKKKTDTRVVTGLKYSF